MNPYVEQLGKLVRDERQRKGWTLMDLASRSNVSIPSIAQFETGKRSLYVESLIAILQALEIPLIVPAGAASAATPTEELLRRLSEAEKDARTGQMLSKRALSAIMVLKSELSASRPAAPLEPPPGSNGGDTEH